MAFNFIIVTILQNNCLNNMTIKIKLPAASGGVSILQSKIYPVASHGEFNPR